MKNLSNNSKSLELSENEVELSENSESSSNNKELSYYAIKINDGGRLRERKWHDCVTFEDGRKNVEEVFKTKAKTNERALPSCDLIDALSYIGLIVRKLYNPDENPSSATFDGMLNEMGVFLKNEPDSAKKEWVLYYLGIVDVLDAARFKVGSITNFSHARNVFFENATTLRGKVFAVLQSLEKARSLEKRRERFDSLKSSEVNAQFMDAFMDCIEYDEADVLGSRVKTVRKFKEIKELASAADPKFVSMLMFESKVSKNVNLLNRACNTFLGVKRSSPNQVKPLPTEIDRRIKVVWRHCPKTELSKVVKRMHIEIRETDLTLRSKKKKTETVIEYHKISSEADKESWDALLAEEKKILSGKLAEYYAETTFAGILLESIGPNFFDEQMRFCLPEEYSDVIMSRKRIISEVVERVRKLDRDSDSREVASVRTDLKAVRAKVEFWYASFEKEFSLPPLIHRVMDLRGFMLKESGGITDGLAKVKSLVAPIDTLPASTYRVNRQAFNLKDMCGLRRDRYFGAFYAFTDNVPESNKVQGVDSFRSFMALQGVVSMTPIQMFMGAGKPVVYHVNAYTSANRKPKYALYLSKKAYEKKANLVTKNSKPERLDVSDLRLDDAYLRGETPFIDLFPLLEKDLTGMSRNDFTLPLLGLSFGDQLKAVREFLGKCKSKKTLCLSRTFPQPFELNKNVYFYVKDNTITIYPSEQVSMYSDTESVPGQLQLTLTYKMGESEVMHKVFTPSQPVYLMSNTAYKRHLESTRQFKAVEKSDAVKPVSSYKDIACDFYKDAKIIPDAVAEKETCFLEVFKAFNILDKCEFLMPMLGLSFAEQLELACASLISKGMLVKKSFYQNTKPEEYSKLKCKDTFLFLFDSGKIECIPISKPQTVSKTSALMKQATDFGVLYVWDQEVNQPANLTENEADDIEMEQTGNDALSVVYEVQSPHKVNVNIPYPDDSIKNQPTNLTKNEADDIVIKPAGNDDLSMLYEVQRTHKVNENMSYPDDFINTFLDVTLEEQIMLSMIRYGLGNLLNCGALHTPLRHAFDMIKRRSQAVESSLVNVNKRYVKGPIVRGMVMFYRYKLFLKGLTGYAFDRIYLASLRSDKQLIN